MAYYPNVSDQRMPLGGQKQFDSAVGEAPDSSAAGLAEMTTTVVNKTTMQNGPTDLSDVVSPNSPRLHSDASYRPGDNRTDPSYLFDPYPDQQTVQGVPLPAKDNRPCLQPIAVGYTPPVTGKMGAPRGPYPPGQKPKGGHG